MTKAFETVVGLISWDRITATSPHEGVRSRRLDSDHLTIIRYELAGGARYPLHRHEQEQFLQGVSGEVGFTVGESTIVVRSGDLVRVPPGIPHRATSRGPSVFFSISPKRRDEHVRGG